jgi:putative PIN family toxin of toxin-antitoxin system
VSERVVIDTNVLVSAMLSRGGSSRNVLRLCLRRRCIPLMGQKLFSECEDVFSRDELMAKSPLSARDRAELLDAFLSICEWASVYYLWRPNLTDEGDNHVIELAIAGSAASIVTHHVRDLRGGELSFPQLRIETPKMFLERWRSEHGNHDDPNS